MVFLKQKQEKKENERKQMSTGVKYKFILFLGVFPTNVDKYFTNIFPKISGKIFFDV